MRILIYCCGPRMSMPGSLTAAFREDGHEVEAFDFSKFLYRTRLGTKWAHALDLALDAQVASRINRALLPLITHGGFDLMIFCSDAHIHPETLKQAASKCKRVVSWKYDEPFNKNYVRKTTLELFRTYHLIFTPRKHLVDQYLERGAQQVIHLPFCVDLGVHFPVTPTAHESTDWGSDVSFVGTWSRLREQLVSALPGVDLKVWGYSWQHARRRTVATPGLKLMRRIATGREMSLVINASKISLNLLTPEQQDRWTVRNLEIPACGGFQLCQRTEESEELFREGREAACYGSFEEMRDKVIYYLGHPAEREVIARAGRERLADLNCTYRDRARQIVACTT